MTETQYAVRSEAVTNAWGEYEGEGWDVQAGAYNPLRAYFVDNALVIAITDTFRRDFITCYHEHFGQDHATSPAVGMTLG
jgi:hypothetical protein